METTSDDAPATGEKPGSTGRRLVMALDEGTPRESRERVPSHYETGIDSVCSSAEVATPGCGPGRGLRSPPFPDPTALSV